jgi:nucleoid DNA-binding protein
MNKLDLIEALKKEAGIGKKEASAAVKLFFKCGKELKERVDG